MCSTLTLVVCGASGNALNFMFFLCIEGCYWVGSQHRKEFCFFMSAKMFLLHVKIVSCVLAESCASLEPKRPTRGVCRRMQGARKSEDRGDIERAAATVAPLT